MIAMQEAATEAGKRFDQATERPRRIARPVAKKIYSPAQLIIPFTIVVLGVVVGGLLFVTSGHVSCQFTQDHLPQVQLYIVGIVAFFLGHWLGELGAPAPKQHTGRGAKTAYRYSRAARISGLGVLSAVSLFEAFGVAQTRLGPLKDAQLEPITFYTRCAIYHDIANAGGFFTNAVVFLTFFLAGHWLWGARPPKRAS